VTGDLFSLAGRVAVITGGTGAIGSTVAEGLARAGASVVVIARNAERLTSTTGRLVAAGHDAAGIAADVLDLDSLERARDEILERYGAVHVLVNCAGGNVAAATLHDGGDPFDVPVEALREVVDLNLLGTLLPTRVLGGAMQHDSGCSIVNVSSMAATRALTRVGGYGAAKAAVESITRWLAVELARRGTGIRVNAIAPGFVVGDQNRALLVREDGELTERGALIVERTPLGRFGIPEELVSTVIWLVSDGARFVTGVVVPVDGGFSAFAGV
jgi:NAD(P)-dependent dehydrogenase (short-subunit alcohol dehydrogenase family)